MAGLPPDPPLTDGEVLLRPWRGSDLPALVAALQDPEIPRWTRVPTPYTGADAGRFLSLAAAGWEATPPTACPFAIVSARTEGLLGGIGLRFFARGVGEVGYWVARPSRRRGIATRAVRLLAPWALRTFDLARLQLTTAPENAASQGVALRSGFSREGTLRSWTELKGARTDAVMFSLVPRDLAARPP
ncbi:MAG: GNAT family N-acetyltransferase [Candidatus Dormibacteraceae bacterium]